jgi:Spy/CpxP family protein refolding chaperone
MKPFQAARAAVLGAALLVAAGAGAQPAMHHHHGRGGPGDFAMAIAAVKGQLNLNTAQQQMWDNAVAASKSARQAARANFASLHDAAAAELANAEPDLASLAARADSTMAQNVAARHQARDAWLALYASFTPDQKAVVANVLRQRMARMDALRQKFQQRHAPRG